MRLRREVPNRPHSPTPLPDEDDRMAAGHDDHALFARAAERARETGRDAIVRLELPLGHVPLETLTQRALSPSAPPLDHPLLSWASRTHRILAIGELDACTLSTEEAQGSADPRRLRAHLDAWRDALCSDAHTAALPLYCGGLSFRRTTPEHAPWQRWPAGRFVLPELLIARMSPEGPTLACGHLRAPPGCTAEALADRAQQLQDDWQRWLERLPALDATRPIDPAATIAHTQERRDDWDTLIARAHEAIHTHRLDKIVVARTETLPLPHLDRGATLEALHQRYPSCTSFAIHDPDLGTFFGATPELLVRQQQSTLGTMALAGTTRRDEDPQRDAELAADLLSSDKDLREHQHVRDAVLQALTALGWEADIDAHPGLLSLSNVHHLCSHVRVPHRQPGDLIDAMLALHPTPAVCGTPREQARQWLAEHEPIDRGWYAGPIGWMNPSGDGEFVVALRSALYREGTLTAFAGAGIVDGSIADQEWEETLHKLRPILESLHLREDGHA